MRRSGGDENFRLPVAGVLPIGVGLVVTMLRPPRLLVRESLDQLSVVQREVPARRLRC